MLVQNISMCDNVPRERKLTATTESTFCSEERIASCSSLDSLADSEEFQIQWEQLHDIEYLTSGGSSTIYTATHNDEHVIIKKVSSELEFDKIYIDELENELRILSSIDHPHIVKFKGAGFNREGRRFIVLERLHGGTLKRTLEFDSKLSDQKRQFWKNKKDKKLSMEDALKYARAIADALSFCHSAAMPGCMVLHRDLKPDNIGFTVAGVDRQLKIFDFGLSRILKDSSSLSDDVYEMSGGTGSLRYMAPENARNESYNHKADVYSFGIILWELLSLKRSFAGCPLDEFKDVVIHGGIRPPINKKWPTEIKNLIVNCWSVDIGKRPTFQQVVTILDDFSDEQQQCSNEAISVTKRNAITSLFYSNKGKRCTSSIYPV